MLIKTAWRNLVEEYLRITAMGQDGTIGQTYSCQLTWHVTKWALSYAGFSAETPTSFHLHLSDA